MRRQRHDRALLAKIAWLARYSASLTCCCIAADRCVAVVKFPLPLRGIWGKWRGPSFGPIVVAIVSLLLIANTRAFGFIIADLDPSQHYKLEEIDLSGERAFSRDTVVSVMTTKERPWYQVWKPLPDFDTRAFTDDLAHIERFYQAHGYYNAHVTYDLTLSTK